MFNRELARRGIVSRRRLLVLLLKTPVTNEVRNRIRDGIAIDFAHE